MCGQFDELVRNKNYPWKLPDIFPKVLTAGENAGCLSKTGALLLDPSGDLAPGIPFCPPEGDAGTGMVATNSVAPRTGNVSAGTSVFAMIVLEHKLSKVYKELDLVTTPSGEPVAMAHSNNCTSEYDSWIELFRSVIEATGGTVKTPQLYDALLSLALEGEKDCGGLLAYGYISGEHMTGFSEGRPLFVRKPDNHFTLANFMRCQLSTSLCAMKTGLNLLFNNENVRVDRVTGHGGFFKTPKVGQKIMAAAFNKPVSVLSTAGEGGAWGIALLASFMLNGGTQSLAEFLAGNVFKGDKMTTCMPDPDDVKGFTDFFTRYTKGLGIERAAVQLLTT
jgi:sugar (pentulose or hexulose) kinase